jgi:hypothetical protein
MYTKILLWVSVFEDKEASTLILITVCFQCCFIFQQRSQISHERLIKSFSKQIEKKSDKDYEIENKHLRNLIGNVSHDMKTVSNYYYIILLFSESFILLLL